VIKSSVSRQIYKNKIVGEYIAALLDSFPCSRHVTCSHAFGSGSDYDNRLGSRTDISHLLFLITGMSSCVPFIDRSLTVCDFLLHWFIKKIKPWFIPDCIFEMAPLSVI
jgi:hypothetical protein